MPGFSLPSKMLHMSISIEDISGVENMLAAGADVNWPDNNDGMIPLIRALKKNNSQIVSRLLKVKSLRVSKAQEDEMKRITCNRCNCSQNLHDRYLKAKLEVESQRQEKPRPVLHTADNKCSAEKSAFISQFMDLIRETCREDEKQPSEAEKSEPQPLQEGESVSPFFSQFQDRIGPCGFGN